LNVREVEATERVSEATDNKILYTTTYSVKA